MIYFILAYEFLKIGLFSFGGGYATIPFLYDIATKYGWYSIKELANMTAVASITPGPIGINAATYAGIKTAGLIGATVSTISEVLPSLILVIILSKILIKYSENFYVKSVIETLKPVSCALLAAVAIGMITPEITDLRAVLLFLILLILSWKSKQEPLFYILIGGIYGLIKVLI